ncbi:MAG: type II toxin-antitoxin system HicA family toxin [archaeon]
MPKLQNISADKVIKVLKSAGYSISRQKGSHIILRKENRLIVVPNHKKLKIGTLLQIIKCSNLTKEEFENLL